MRKSESCWKRWKASRRASLCCAPILTGLRAGELFGLRWKDVSWAPPLLGVRRRLWWDWRKGAKLPRWSLDKPKTKYAVRKVDMGPVVKAELRALWLKSGRDPEAFVFQSKAGGPLVPQNVYRRGLVPAVRASKIGGDVRWHDLRHTYGSLKLAQGEDAVYVSRQMGHSSPAITLEVYAHQIRAQRPEAAAATERAIFGA